MGGRVKPTTKRTKALKTPAAKVPRTKKCDDDALEKDWQRSYCTMIKIEPFSTASAAGRPQDLVYCEIRHKTPIQFRVRGGHAECSNDLVEENDGWPDIERVVHQALPTWKSKERIASK